MFLSRIIFLLAATLLGWLPISASAQVLVYKFSVTKAQGINFYTYDGGYVISPLLGGKATFLLTYTDGGRYYAEAAEAGTLFTAVQGDNQTRAVLFSTTGGSTVSGALLATGEINKTVHIKTRTLNLAAKVAETLRGTLLSASPESDQETTAADGSIGVAGTAEIKLSLDLERTNNMNSAGLNLEGTATQLKLELERTGHTTQDSDDDDQDSDDGDTTTDTDTGTETTGTTTTDSTGTYIISTGNGSTTGSN